MDVREILRILRRHAWIVVVAVGAALAWSVLGIVRETPTYRATAVIQLVDARRQLAGNWIDPAAEKVLGRGIDPILSQLRVLQSRSIAGAVVDTLGLRVRPLPPAPSAGLIENVSLPSAEIRDTLRLLFHGDGVVVGVPGEVVSATYGSPLEIRGIRFTVPAAPGLESAVVVVLPREEAIDTLRQNLRIDRQDFADVVEVEYSSTNPGDAERVVNTLVIAFQQASADAAKRQSRLRREFLERQIAQSEARLIDAQSRLSAFRTREQVFSARDRLETGQADLATLEMRRGEMLANREVYRRLLQALRQARPGEMTERLGAIAAAPEIAANGAISQLYRQLIGHEAEIEALTTGPWAHAPTHPDVKRLQGQVEATQQSLIAATRSFLATQDARLSALESQIARRTATVGRLPQAEAEELRLAEQVETGRRSLEQLREQYQVARVAEEVEVGQVEIIDLAASAVPAESNRTIKLGIGLLAGLFLGVTGAFLREGMAATVRDRGELDRLLSRPSLAVIPPIPAIARPGARARIARTMGIASLERSIPGHPSAAGLRFSAPTMAQEVFRALQAKLLFAQAATPLKTLVVTSPTLGDGKTTVVVNLGLALARAGKRVLLVDWDLRRPLLHDVLEVSQAPGVAELVSGRIPAFMGIHRTQVDGLYLVPSGSLRPDPLEQPNLDTVRRLLDSLGEQFDLVILDTPPVLSVVDGAVLGRLADGVLLVVRAGRTPAGAVRESLQQLASLGCLVIGAVLNDPDGGATYYQNGYYGPVEPGIARQPAAARSVSHDPVGPGA